MLLNHLSLSTFTLTLSLYLSFSRSLSSLSLSSDLLLSVFPSLFLLPHSWYFLSLSASRFNPPLFFNFLSSFCFFLLLFSSLLLHGNTCSASFYQSLSSPPVLLLSFWGLIFFCRLFFFHVRSCHVHSLLCALFSDVLEVFELMFFFLWAISFLPVEPVRALRRLRGNFSPLAIAFFLSTLACEQISTVRAKKSPIVRTRSSDYKRYRMYKFFFI